MVKPRHWHTKDGLKWPCDGDSQCDPSIPLAHGREPYAPIDSPPTKLTPCEFCNGTGWKVPEANTHIWFATILLLMMVPFAIGLVEIGIMTGVLKRYEKNITSVELNKDLFK